MTHAELIARLSNLEGPDRGVDAAVHALFHESVWKFADGRKVFGDVPKYTESIDAAVSLAERVLPGWEWSVGKDRAEIAPEPWTYDVLAEDVGGFSVFNRPGAIALIIAVLKAKEAEECNC